MSKDFQEITAFGVMFFLIALGIGSCTFLAQAPSMPDKCQTQETQDNEHE